VYDNGSTGTLDLFRSAGSGISSNFIDKPLFPLNHFYHTDPNIMISGRSYTAALALAEAGIKVPFAISAETNMEDVLPIGMAEVKLRNPNTVVLSPYGLLSNLP